MRLLDAFTHHPATVGETYGGHLVFASGVGGRMVLAGLACMLHGIFPFLFERTGSRAILDLHGRVTSGARAQTSAPAPALQHAAVRELNRREAA
jgi:hypothetical protein